jgi:ATP/maltotriose-dependent transcriptional regulator MalT
MNLTAHTRPLGRDRPPIPLVTDPLEAPALSMREGEVLRLVAKGFSTHEIARLLAISSHTVTTHVRHLYRKLEVHSRGAAVYEAVQLGLIRLDE